MKQIPMTPRGYELLKTELNQLKSVERPRNIQAIEEARAHGDLSENAEFGAAKERQSFLEGSIYCKMEASNIWHVSLLRIA